MAPEEEESEARVRMISEFFAKSLNVILGARIPASKYLEIQNSSGNKIQQQVSSDPSFNIQLLDSPLRSNCHLSAAEPIVVDVLLVHDDGNTKSFSTSTPSLIERWVLQCVPSTRSNSATSNPSKKDQFSKVKNLKPPSYKSPEKQTHQAWRRVVRMLSLMLRSLYSLTRLLPAYRVFQQLKSSSRESPRSFDLSYKVRTSVLASERSSGDLSKFSVAPVDTELGRMCIVVKYSSRCNVEKAMRRRHSIFSDIIPNYLGEANPHFAVNSDAPRLLPATRTKSSNIPLAAVSRATGEACVRRSYSSPLQVSTDDAHEQRLVCPFASDDELENCRRMEPICSVQGTSRDAAVGALITSLRQAKPLETNHRTFTVGHALRQLQSYSESKY